MIIDRLANWLVSFLRVTGSAVDGPHSAVLMGGEGSVAGADDDGEIVQDAEAYGAPGIVWRPRPPESVDTPAGTESVAAEAVGLRTGDGVAPVAWRDLRWHRAFPNPKPGTGAFVGYGGGFLSFDDSDAACGDQKASIEVLYCPYAFAAGTPAKAHAIFLDPEDESVTIVHGEGQSILLQSDGTLRLQSPDGQSYIQVENGKITIQSALVIVNGGAVVVGDPRGAIVPMATGLEPCPRLFLNPAA